jgi:predicted nucleotidyltransferase
MRPSEILRKHRSDIIAIATANHVCNVRVFGSAVRGEDTEESDLDLLVDPTSETTLLDIARIQNRLRALLGVAVDVLTPKALPDSFRDKVLAEAVPV